MKLCKDCKWCIPGTPALCNHPKHRSRVDDQAFKLCELMRGYLNNCDEEAKLFEPKESK